MFRKSGVADLALFHGTFLTAINISQNNFHLRRCLFKNSSFLYFIILLFIIHSCLCTLDAWVRAAYSRHSVICSLHRNVLLKDLNTKLHTEIIELTFNVKLFLVFKWSQVVFTLNCSYIHSNIIIFHFDEKSCDKRSS